MGKVRDLSSSKILLNFTKTERKSAASQKEKEKNLNSKIKVHKETFLGMILQLK